MPAFKPLRLILKLGCLWPHARDMFELFFEIHEHLILALFLLWCDMFELSFQLKLCVLFVILYSNYTLLIKFLFSFDKVFYLIKLIFLFVIESFSCLISLFLRLMQHKQSQAPGHLWTYVSYSRARDPTPLPHMIIPTGAESWLRTRSHSACLFLKLNHVVLRCLSWTRLLLILSRALAILLFRTRTFLKLYFIWGGRLQLDFETGRGSKPRTISLQWIELRDNLRLLWLLNTITRIIGIRAFTRAQDLRDGCLHCLVVPACERRTAYFILPRRSRVFLLNDCSIFNRYLLHLIMIRANLSRICLQVLLSELILWPLLDSIEELRRWFLHLLPLYITPWHVMWRIIKRDIFDLWLYRVFSTNIWII